MNNQNKNALKNITHPDDIVNFTKIKKYIQSGMPLNKDKINYIAKLDKTK